MMRPEEFKVFMMESHFPPANQDQRRVRVLLVDDMPQVRRDLHQLLELTGSIEVIAEAADGQQAVRLAAELSPDVIIMDLEMPGMDGFDATEKIKAQGLSSRIVILSMHISQENIARAMSAGADEFIVKGASFDILIDAILGRKDAPDPIHQEKGN